MEILWSKLCKNFLTGNPIIGEQENPNLSEVLNTETETVNELIKRAREYYDQANQRLKEGDWSGYGENISKLGDVIRKIGTSAVGQGL
jgi:uncharacterized membrane protein (UPF0182 family)